MRRDPIGARAREIRAVSERFTSRRDERSPGYLQHPKTRAAYALYYVPTGAATAMTAARLADPGWADGRSTLRILDLGAGPLSASIGLAVASGIRDISVTAVDTSTAAMRDGRSILAELMPDAKVRLISADLRALAGIRDIKGSFDVIVAANLFNEWPAARMEGVAPITGLIDRLVAKHLAEDGFLLVIEPGTRPASRRLIAVRESLCETTDLQVFAPCVGSMPCPLAPDKVRDWCHAEQPWDRPKHIAQLDKRMGRRRATLKFSYLAIRTAATDRPATGFRVIGGPMRDGDDFRRYLCGSNGRVVALGSSAGLGRAHPVVRAWRGDRIDVSGRLTEGRRRGEATLKVK